MAVSLRGTDERSLHNESVPIPLFRYLLQWFVVALLGGLQAQVSESFSFSATCNP
jgi:hypothetical protein